jgi:hypothetical protein
VHCENPCHEQHLQTFLRRYLSASKTATYPIIEVSLEYWFADIEHEDRNTVKSCLICSIQEDIKRITSPGRTGQPATAELVSGS